jgi:MFS family permease
MYILFFVLFFKIGFGAILVLSAMAFGNLFGFVNFGVFFSLMQIAGSGGSVLNPIISGAMFQSMGSYVAFPWMWAGMLLISAILLAVVPITKYKR